ncbi:MAG: TetR family transcriptional regulator [Eubacteriales bacterium]
MEFAQLKDKILYYTKKEFYEKGYIASKLKDIAIKTNVKPALITYHFKSKQGLASTIYTEFYRAIHNKLDEYPELNISNSLYKQVLVSYIYYSIIMLDKNNKRFYGEVAEKYFSNYEMHKEVTDIVYHNYIRDFHLSISKMDFTVYTFMRSGARALFFKKYIDGNLNLSIAEIVRYVESIMPRLMGIDQQAIDSILLRADHIIKEIDYSDLKFLI